MSRLPWLTREFVKKTIITNIIIYTIRLNTISKQETL